MTEPHAPVRAVWYDGETALRHEGFATWIEPDTLRLTDDSGATLDVPRWDVRYAETLRDQISYRRASLPDFRLRLPADTPSGFAAHLPATQEYGRWVDRLGLGRAATIFALASAGAVALFMTAPDWLGPRVPLGWEQRLGDAMVGDFGNRLCSTPAGDAALARLLDAVDPAREQVRAGVANIDMVNAVALPGGRVLLFDGLVQQAESPEELAGVLGHEVGHVRERHVMTALLRQFGLSILLSGANSGIGDTMFGLAAMDYSREAEREADAFARARMAESDVSPVGAAKFFERLADEDSGENDALTGWIASHPSSGERARAYREAAEEGRDYPPVLTASEFRALKSMCEEDEDVETFDFF